MTARLLSLVIFRVFVWNTCDAALPEGGDATVRRAVAGAPNLGVELALRDRIVPFDDNRRIVEASFADNGNTLVLLAADAGSVRPTHVVLWDVHANRVIRSFESSEGLSAVTFVPATNTLVTGIYGGELRLSDWRSTPRTLSKWELLFDGVTAIAPRRDGSAVAIATSGFTFEELLEPALNNESRSGQRTNLRVLTVAKQEFSRRSLIADNGIAESFIAVKYSPDSKWLGTASARSGYLRVWDAKSWKERTTAYGGCWASDIGSIAFSPDSKLLASGTRPKREPDRKGVLVELFNVDGRRPSGKIPGRRQAVKGLSFSMDGRLLALAVWDYRRVAADDSDDRIEVWDVEKLQKVHSILPQETRRRRTFLTEFSPDGATLMTCLDGRTVEFWQRSKK